MKKIKKYGTVRITEESLALPEVKEIRAKYKYLGFTVAVIIEMRLTELKHAIGRISRLRPVSHEVGVQLKTLLDIMNNCSMFVMDYEHDLFYMPRLRKKFNLPIIPTEEEIADIQRNGNVYFGYAEKEVPAEKRSEKDSEKIRERSEIVHTQSADNQDESVHVYKSKDKVFKNKDKDVNIENDEDADDENIFKEIFTDTKWCRSINKRHGVNLEDERILGIFTEWFKDYCCSNDKTPDGKTDVRRYANNLLRNGTNTRAEFDRYLEKTLNTCTPEPDADENQEPAFRENGYEYIVSGVRISDEGQVIPTNAPAQPEPRMAYSYISDEWIPYDEYDETAETKELERKKKECPDYVKNLEKIGG